MCDYDEPSLYNAIIALLHKYARTPSDMVDIYSSLVRRSIEKVMVLSGKKSAISNFSQEEEILAQRILALLPSNIPDKPKSPALTHVISSRCKS
jgi:hypothetical protein